MAFLKFWEKEKEKERGEKPELPKLPPIKGAKKAPGSKKLPPLPPFEEKPGIPEKPAGKPKQAEKMPLFDIQPPEELPIPGKPRKTPAPPEAPPAPKPKKAPEPARQARPLFPEVKKEPPTELPEFPKVARRKPMPPKIVEEVEEKEYELEKRELEEMKKRIPKPVFIEINDFKEVMEFLGQIKNELKNGDGIMYKLNEIKGMQDKKYDSWKNTMQDLERKFIYVEKTIFERKHHR